MITQEPHSQEFRKTNTDKHHPSGPITLQTTFQVKYFHKYRSFVKDNREWLKIQPF